MISSTGQRFFMEPQQSWYQTTSFVSINQKKREVEHLGNCAQLMPYTNSLHQKRMALACGLEVNAKALTRSWIESNRANYRQHKYVALWKTWHPLLEALKAVANIILGEEYPKRLSLQGRKLSWKAILLKTDRCGQVIFEDRTLLFCGWK